MTIETEFNIGQKVFYIEHGYIRPGTITNIIIKVRQAVDRSVGIDGFINIVYTIDDKSLSDTEIFATPTELLKHIEKQLPNAKL